MRLQVCLGSVVGTERWGRGCLYPGEDLVARAEVRLKIAHFCTGWGHTPCTGLTVIPSKFMPTRNHRL